MVSAESINVAARFAHTVYRLAAGVQVRAEKRGLLFYQRKGPRLYFISSAEWLAPEYFSSGQRLDDWLYSHAVYDPNVQASLSDVLFNLVEKGVLVAD
jgi:putative mycofactocin binding protein MftB